MANRDRIIRKDFYADSSMREFSDSMLVVFTGLWSVSDDSGVLLDDPEAIEAEIFPRNRPTEALLDTFVATGRLQRAVAPDGRRVLVIKNFYRHNTGLQNPSRPRICYRWELSLVPTPSDKQRGFVKTKYDVTGWDPRVDVECESCGKKGWLRFAAPVGGTESESAVWLGAVVASRVEIVPIGEGPEDVVLLCRDCRTDTEYSGPTGVPDSKWTDGDYPNSKSYQRLGAKQPLLSANWIAAHKWTPPPREDGVPYEEIAVGPMAVSVAREAKVVTLHSGADPTEGRPRPAVAKGGAPATEVTPDVQEVFDAWRATIDTDSEVRLDPRRKKVIVGALKDYPKQDVLDAVVGWKNIPFNQGDNRDGQKIFEITSLLKSSSDIERYRDAARQRTAERS